MQTSGALTESECKVWIRHQSRSSCRRNIKLFSIDINVNCRSSEGAVSEERVEGTDDENRGFLPFRPLERIVGIICRDWIKSLSIASVVTCGGIEIDCSGDVDFMCMAIVVSISIRASRKGASDLPMSYMPGALLNSLCIRHFV